MTRHADIAIPSSGAYVLRRARVPGCFLRQPLVGQQVDPEGSVLLDIHVEGEKIAGVRLAGSKPGDGVQIEIDLQGRQVWATLIDMHAHLDKGQVVPRVAPDGSLSGGITLTAADQSRWTLQDVRQRMEFGIRCAYVHGVSVIRTHIDSVDPRTTPMSWEAFSELRTAWAGKMALQAVGITPLTAFLDHSGVELADRVAAAKGILGGWTDGIAQHGPDRADLDGLLDRFFSAAGDRGLDVDLHVDQSDDVDAFTLPDVARAVLRTGFDGRVVVDHCVNLALQPASVIERTIDLCLQAKLAFVTLPTPMMYLQDRHVGRTPRWRGVTVAHELMAAGVPVAIGGDNCRDAWFPFGDHDMVDTVKQSVRVFQLDNPIAQAVAMAGPIPSAIVEQPDIGWIDEGSTARFILFGARTLNELMCRPQADRIVIDRGQRITDALPDYEELTPTATLLASSAFRARF